MRNNHVKIIALAFALRIVLPGAGIQAVAQDGKAAYPAMAPLDQYQIADEKSEVALARSAAPGSISDGAEVMVLDTRDIGTDGTRLLSSSWLCEVGIGREGLTGSARSAPGRQSGLVRTGREAPS